MRLTVMLFRRLHVPGRFGQDLPGAVIDGTVLAWRRLDSFGHAEVLIQHFEAGRGMIGTRPRGGEAAEERRIEIRELSDPEHERRREVFGPMGR